MGAKKRRVALVLGGGGARGIAHIGAIGELERRGFEIAAVAGTSMGAGRRHVRCGASGAFPGVDVRAGPL